MNKDLLLFVLLNCFPTVRNIEYYSCSYYTILTGHYTENRQELKSRQASNVLMLNVVSGLEFVPPIVAECTRPARAVLPRVPTPGSQQPLSTIEVVARRSAVWTPPEPPLISAILLWAADAENAVDPYFIAASGRGFMKQNYVTSQIYHIG